MDRINDLITELLGTVNVDNNTTTNPNIPYTSENRIAFYNKAKEMVKLYITNGNIVVNLRWGQIRLSKDIPLTVLSILPLVVDGMGAYGNYNVYVGNQLRGNVRYDGMPSPLDIAIDRTMGALAIGVKATFKEAPEPVTLEQIVMEQGKVNKNMRSYDLNSEGGN